MKWVKKTLQPSLILCMAVFLLSLALPLIVDSSKFTVIVNEQNDISELSLIELKSIFLSKTIRWPNGIKIEVWLPPSGSEEMAVLLSEVLKIQDEADLKKFYLTAIFQQKITTIPPSVIDNRDATGKVAYGQGGIAIVNESAIMGLTGIKVLKVEGL